MKNVKGIKTRDRLIEKTLLHSSFNVQRFHLKEARTSLSFDL